MRKRIRNGKGLKAKFGARIKIHPKKLTRNQKTRKLWKYKRHSRECKRRQNSKQRKTEDNLCQTE